ncbi:G-type lectin S-receptor-like serine/threonine-protein kinase LECRK3 [Rosa rugosa]|uniref:G-type lectin S-receptor-like serine/threonine-protein kinase LECRK3 n=1 Tax=Rosa rugosa TaxID=74645 RepID=UPI002B40C7CD|nr:G-type lectin S-receptor-like serine/threonine-protein kinase LECRK3 [Rosa rugosa]
MAFSVLHLLALYLIVQPFCVPAAQTANISLGLSLSASDNSLSWQSPSGEFAFGFRRIGDQDLFLLAIWYDKIPEKTLVWYANGDNPASKGSKVELTKDGYFRLTGPRKEEIWPQPVISGVAYAAMLDSGNFVLANQNSAPLWQSFKDPRDTILPTRVLEIGETLSSRQTASNYSKGKFQLQFKPAGNLELYPIALPTEFEYKAYYKSNTSDAADKLNSGYQLAFNESGHINVVLRNGNIVTLTNKTASPSRDYYYRATLDYDGLFTLYAYPKNGSGTSWSSLWSIPENICFAFDSTGEEGGGPCGYNSYCRLDANTRPICECVPGFSALDPQYKLRGCKQNRMHSCELGDSKPQDVYVMHELPNTFWPSSSNFEVLQQLNEDDCSRSCLDDCNCVVAVVRAGSCWKKKLPLSNGRQDWNEYGKALIKMPKSDAFEKPASRDSNTEKKDQKTLILVGALLLGSSVFINFLLVAAIALLVFYTYRKTHRVITSTSSILEANLRGFTYKELEEATDGFREELGRGAFGTVYKGVISSPSSTNYVAIKKLDKVAQQGEKEFKTEVSAIAKTHHKNLVRLLGMCDEGANRLLVYEFMSNGTLASFLFGISRPDWNKRIQIALGIARGLMYLHDECSTQIIHCDIKPHNILLDDSFTARISDFGLAKLLLSDQTLTHTVIRGTRGYVAPEWFRNTPVTAKVDVYSYGVMLFEIICCRRSLEMERKNEEEKILTDWVYDCYKQRRLNKMIGDDEEARNDMKRLERLVMVAIWCIQEDPSLRPTMKKVTQMLEGVVDVSVPPSPFSF